MKRRQTLLPVLLSFAITAAGVFTVLPSEASAGKAEEPREEIVLGARPDSVSEAVPDTDSHAEAVPESAASSAAEEAEAYEPVSGAESAVEITGAEPVREAAEWTVMMYLCGSDLESEEALAAYNLMQIAEVRPNPSVNFIIETGGAKKWHLEELNMEVDPGKLQRWSYTEKGFQLVGEADSASMGSSDTLSDFIRWTASGYPAEKYQLILWDHGGGSNEGVIFDELYNDGCLASYSLADALKDGGVHFENIFADTCLTANLETAEAVAPYASWFTGCEETMPGQGSCYLDWVRYLYDNPACDGAGLGKRICESAEQMYSEMDSEPSMGMLTLSVIDLSAVGAVHAAFDRFIEEADALLDDPDTFYDYGLATDLRECYCAPEMADLYDLAHCASGHGISDEAVLALEEAVQNAVVWIVRGNHHSRSHGLSVFYTLNAGTTELDHYARVFADPVYLAFLDRVSYTWTAPDWVYETAERKPDIKREPYASDFEVSLTDDGSAAGIFIGGDNRSVTTIQCALLRWDEELGTYVFLGRDPDLDMQKTDDGTYFSTSFDGKWPFLDGVPLSMDINEERVQYVLYNVPVFLDGENKILRVQTLTDAGNGETEEGDDGTEYRILGIWDGMDFHDGFPGRNLVPLTEDTELVIPTVVYNEENGVTTPICNREPFAFKNSKGIQEETLPAGEYALRFITGDIFGSENIQGSRVLCSWDGEKAVFRMSDDPVEEASSDEGEEEPPSVQNDIEARLQLVRSSRKSGT